MRKIQLQSYGAPEMVAECVEVDNVGVPAADEVVFDVLAFPLNPADLAFCRGRYRLKPPLPATPGAECVGRVTAVGADVTRLKPGQLVMNLDRENWAQRRRVRADRVIRLPDDLDPTQAAMMRINPPTAWLLLTDLVTLEPGDWIIQNVANSSVGKMIITFARERGIRTVNVVRRADVFDELHALGADVCLVDSDDLAEQVTAKTGGAPIRLAIDAVGGKATARLAACLIQEGTCCTYGSMSGEDIVLTSPDLVYRGLNFTGFLLGRLLERRSHQEIEQLYADLVARFNAGNLRLHVERIYPIEDIKAALTHVQKTGKGGKILIAPNGLDALEPSV